MTDITYHLIFTCSMVAIMIAIFFLVGKYFDQSQNAAATNSLDFSSLSDKDRLYLAMFSIFLSSIEILFSLDGEQENQFFPHLTIGILGLACAYISKYIPIVYKHLHSILSALFLSFTLLLCYKITYNPSDIATYAEVLTLYVFAYFVFHKTLYFYLYMLMFFAFLFIIRLQEMIDTPIFLVYCRMLIIASTLNYIRDISKKQTELELKAKNEALENTQKQLLLVQAEQEKFVNLVKFSDAFIAIADMNGRMLFLNEKAKVMSGQSENYIGTKINHFHSPEGVKLLHETVLPQVLETGMWRGEHDILNIQTGKVHHTDATIFLIKDPITNQPTAIATIQIDITERKITENEIKQLSVLHQSLLDNVPGYVVCKDYNGHFLFVNKALAELFGKPAYEVIGLTDADYGASPEEIAHYLKADRQVIDSGKPLFIPEEPVLRKDGSRGIFQTNKVPVSIMGIDKGAVLVVTTDITDLKQTEEKLLKSQKQLVYKSNLLSAIAKTTEKLLISKNIYGTLQESFELIGKATQVDRIYFFEKDIQLDFVNQKIEWARDTIIPQIDNPLLQKVNIDHFPDLKNHLFHNQTYIMLVSEIKDITFKELLISQGILSMLNIPIFIKNSFYGFIGFDDCSQSRIWTEDEISILQSLATNVANAIERVNNEAIMERDVTEKIEKQQQLQRLVEVTSKQNERLMNFAHIVSHNIRSHSSNLSMIVNFIDNAQNPDEGISFLKMLKQSTTKLAETIENLNEIITVQNSLNTHKTSIFLKEEIQKTIHSLNILTLSNDITIHNNVPNHLTIKGIHSYIESIFLNLLTNALKYRSHERPLLITINAQQQAEYLLLTIQDNGLGLDLQKHGHKIFGMYKTFHHNKDARGIGLFITKNQIEAMGGKIEVESEVNVGTTFYVYFPIND